MLTKKKMKIKKKQLFDPMEIKSKNEQRNDQTLK